VIRSTQPFSESVGFYYSPVFLEHKTFPHHPEQPDRLRAIVDHMKQSGLWNRVLRPSGKHAMAEEQLNEHILRSHPQQHIDYINRKGREAKQNGGTIAPFSDGGDTNISEHSYTVARKALETAINATEQVLTGTYRRAFCAIRPPGHHCERNRPMGFCLFNNVAVATRYAQQVHGIERIAIVDWDVHHGNGTQAIFYDDPSVLYISLHQYPHYPGTGSAQERGTGKAEGTTMNFPLPAGTDESTYMRILRGSIVPSIKKFQPGILFISAGFDAHRDDPLGDMLLTDRSFAHLTTQMIEAASVCEGRIVSLLEGGYNLNALPGSVAAHLSALGGIEIYRGEEEEQSI
jgi:acetoin utilization deacetylase AcuC-like enzyme